MPITSLTVPDTSPWITYTGGWTDVETTRIGNYTNNNAHATINRGAKASIVFNGTSIQLFGATKSDHGKYSVSLDGVPAGSFDGRRTTDMFQQPLYSALTLPMGLHTIILTSMEQGPSLDLDYALIEIGDGNVETTLNEVQMDDTHFNITYSNFTKIPREPNGDWFMDTYHTTSAANGKATIRFNGNAISLHGSTSDLHGLYAVSLDGGPQQTFYGDIDRPNTYRPQQLLYLASNLPRGPHVLELTNLEEGKILDFDYATVTTYADPSGSGLGSSPKDTTTSTAAIAGGTLGGVAVLAFLSIIIYLILRRRRHRLSSYGQFDVERMKTVQALGQDLVSEVVTVGYKHSYGVSHKFSPHHNHPGQSQPPPGPGGKRGAYGQQHQRNVSGGGDFETDVPPPNYNHVFAPPT